MVILASELYIKDWGTSTPYLWSELYINIFINNIIQVTFLSTLPSGSMWTAVGDFPLSVACFFFFFFLSADVSFRNKIVRLHFISHQFFFPFMKNENRKTRIVCLTPQKNIVVLLPNQTLDANKLICIINWQENFRA